MQTSKSQKILDRAAKYETEAWAEKFSNHGIDAKYHNKWFFNYEAVTGQQKANLETVRAACRNNTSLALLGAVGNGKTHLATSLLKDLIVSPREGSKYQVGRYYTFADLHRRYRESVTSRDISEVAFMRRVCMMKCLIIDEIQLRSDSSSEKRMLQEIVDKRCANHKQTVYIGNLSFKGFTEILEPRLMDRLKDDGFKVLVFSGESYRGK